MSNGFEQRIELADKFETSFIEAFNQNCTTHKVIKYGIESTRLAEAHEFIRLCQDETSKFIRYIPDSVLVSVDQNKRDTTLLEFKVAEKGIYSERFFRELSAQHCPNMEPPFASKEDVFNIEAEALNLYRKLTTIGVDVVVVAYAAYRSDTPIRAQCIQDIVVCGDTYDPTQGQGSKGSGTHIANTNFASFVQLADLFREKLRIDPSIMQTVEDAIISNFA